MESPKLVTHNESRHEKSDLSVGGTSPTSPDTGADVAGYISEISGGMPHTPEVSQQKHQEAETRSKATTDFWHALTKLIESSSGVPRLQATIAELKKRIDELEGEQALRPLLDRVGPKAQSLLLRHPEFQEKFSGAVRAYVVSVDIRRSTELMLKARDPTNYAQFIIGLTRVMRDMVTESHGVFDKFTGDGILCYYPEFLSGEDAGARALQVAERFHRVFKMRYHVARQDFLVVSKCVGLGVGIDYGDVHIVKIGSELTVVGPPVVYACRMAGAVAGQTLLNHPAYFEIANNNRYRFFKFRQTEIDAKNEGILEAYEAVPTDQPYDPYEPPWIHGTGSAKSNEVSGS